MYTLPEAITVDVLREYASYLFSQISKSRHLPFKKVLVNGNPPLPRNCHENARKYVQSDPSSKIVYGWIFTEAEYTSSHIEFVAHSVIEDRNGDLYEITPILSNEPTLFLRANLNELDFADTVNELERLAGTATLIHNIN